MRMKAIFVELPAFAKYRSEYLNDKGFRDLQNTFANSGASWTLIPAEAGQ
jgi:hypothetical protein